jgi:ubiquinone/menaquinone biosynthesis C-methylase UbiE
MGLKYLTPDEIKINKEIVYKEVTDRSTYFIRKKIVIDKVKKYFKIQDKMLDIGCGAGELAVDLMAAGYNNINLVDIDNYLKPELVTRMQLNVLDVCFNKLPFADKVFNLVTAIAVFEHLENQHFPLREINRVLKSGGLFFMAIPNVFSMRSRITYLLKGDLKSYNVHNNHITLFTKAIFEKTVLNKFDLEEIIYSNGYIKVFGKKINFKFDNNLLNSLFGDKVLYILKKNN